MKKIFKYFVMLILIVLLWNKLVLRPLKVLALFLHKGGHALTALAFGYGGNSFKYIFENGNDIILQSESWIASFIMTNGGYLGSLLFGSLILLLRNSPIKKFILGSLAMVYLFISVSYFAFRANILDSIIFASIIIILYMIGNDKINQLMIEIVGIATLTYVIHDTFVDTILHLINSQFSVLKPWRTEFPGDIMELSKLSYIPPVLWGIIWLVITVIILNIILIKTKAPAKAKAPSAKSAKS